MNLKTKKMKSMNTQKAILIFFTVAMFMFVNTGFSQNSQNKKMLVKVENSNFSKQDVVFDNFESKTMDLYINKNNDSYSAFNCCKEKRQDAQILQKYSLISEKQAISLPFNIERKMSYDETQYELQAALMTFD